MGGRKELRTRDIEASILGTWDVRRAGATHVVDTWDCNKVLTALRQRWLHRIGSADAKEHPTETDKAQFLTVVDALQRYAKRGIH